MDRNFCPGLNLGEVSNQVLNRVLLAVKLAVLKQGVIVASDSSKDTIVLDELLGVAGHIPLSRQFVISFGLVALHYAAHLCALIHLVLLLLHRGGLAVGLRHLRHLGHLLSHLRHLHT